MNAQSKSRMTYAGLPDILYPIRSIKKRMFMVTTDRNFYVALGRVIDREGVTFNPGFIAEEISRETGRPEESVLGSVLEQCRELVELGVLWFTSKGKYIYIRRDSCLTVNRLRVLRQIIERFKKEMASPP